MFCYYRRGWLLGCCILNRLLAWPQRTSPEPMHGDRQGSPVQTTIKIWRFSSEGNFSAMRTKVPFIFTSVLGIFCILNHIGPTSDFFRICFIVAAIIVRDLPLAILSWAARHAFTYARGHGLPCLWFLLSVCDTFTDPLPFFPVANTKLHVNSVTPWQKHWQFLPAN